MPRKPQSAPSDDRDVIAFSVRLTSADGQTTKFESEVRMPFSCDPVAQQRTVEQWLDIMQTGFRIGALSMSVTLKDKDVPQSAS